MNIWVKVKTLKIGLSLVTMNQAVIIKTVINKKTTGPKYSILSGLSGPQLDGHVGSQPPGCSMRFLFVL